MAMRCLLVVLLNYFLVVCAITGSPVELSYAARKFQADIQQQVRVAIFLVNNNKINYEKVEFTDDFGFIGKSIKEFGYNL